MTRLLILTAWVLALPHVLLSAEPRRNNIVLFLIDDLGWMDLGCQGSTYYRTPHIDRLAAEGVRFTDAYASCAVCTPTRAAILTGKCPARLLMTNWTPDGRWNPQARFREARFLRALPLEEITIAEALREAGYRTASIGKWHLGGPPFSLPEHHGFDINIAGNAHGAPGDYFYPYQGDWLIPTTGLRARWNVLPDGQAGEYLTDRLTDEAVKYIRAHRDEPFFLYFPHYAVHTPLQAKPATVATYEQVPEAERQGDPVYAAMVQSVDDSVGRVLATLKDLGLEEHTIVIVASDNGGFWRATQHAPLRGHKGTYWEGGIRVPLIVKWPGVSIPGRVVSEPVISSDLYPTILAAAGLPMRPHQHLDGLNLTPLLRDADTLPRKSLFWHFPHYNDHPQTVPQGVIRQGPWKLIETYDPAGELQLYNLDEDLGEATNLAAEKPELAGRLLNELDAWRRDVGADMMRPNPDYDPAVERPKKGKKKAKLRVPE
ncbi:MAG: sulfatase [Pirellulaceae bacterium]|nr:sulfatase [Pirellulaceae bacterium]